MTSPFPVGATITGVGISAVGRRLGRDGLDLTIDACLAAIADAGLNPDDINGVASYPGAYFPAPGFNGTSTNALRDALNLRCNWYLGAFETAGQLGPLVEACLAVICGLADHVVCFRSVVESSAQVGRRAASLADDAGTAFIASPWQAAFGALSPANWVAMLAQRYMAEFGLTREQLAQIALNGRRNAQSNPSAIYRDPLTMSDYLNSRMISSPLCLFDCDVPCDGSVAIVVSHAKHGGGLRRQPIAVESVGTAMLERLQWDQRRVLTTTATHDAAAHLWNRTSIKPADVDIAELYDGFSYFTLQWLEALGFCPHGQAGAFVEGGHRIARDGQLPLNTNGGQLSGGRLHGLGLLREACLQLWGDAGDCQIGGPRPEVAVVAAGGGPTAGCMLLSQRS